MYSVLLDAVTEPQRDVGKTQNFAVLYGARETKIASVAKCSLRRASQLIARYYDLFRELEPWKERVLRAAMKAGDRANAAQPPCVVIPPIGRLRRLPDLYRFQDDDRYLKQRAERQAVNAICQGFASNITKLAMIDLHTRLQPYPARMLDPGSRRDRLPGGGEVPG